MVLTLHRPHVLHLAGLVLAIAALPLSAGINEWTVEGPFGGNVSSLVLDPQEPDTLYLAAEQAGFWKSTDGADTWFSLDPGLTLRNAQSVTLDPLDPKIVYGVTNGGLFRSFNGGEQFQLLDSTIGFFLGGPLLIDPTNPSVLYLGTLNQGVLKSIDGGLNWSAIGPLGVTEVVLLAQDPSASQTIYTAGFQTGLWRSLDGGATWTDLGGIAGVTGFVEVVVDPSNSQFLWSATLGGLYRSFDGGQSWTSRDPGLQVFQMASVVFDPRDTEVLWVGSEFGVGVSRSDAGGENWNPIALDRQGSAVRSVVFDPSDPQKMYLGLSRGGGVYRSDDGGQSWHWASDGLIASTVTSVEVEADSGTVWAAVAGSGVFKKDADGGWQPLVDSPRTGYCCLQVALAPVAPGTVYAAGQDGVFKTTDNGATWLDASSGLPQFVQGDRFWVDPMDPQAVFLPNPGGIYRSLNGGTSWQLFTNGLVPGLALRELVWDPTDPSILYGVVDGRMLRSEDRGANWQPHGAVPVPLSFQAIAIDPNDPLHWLAGTPGNGIYRSTDGGFNWLLVDGTDGFFTWRIRFDETSAPLATLFDGLWQGAPGSESGALVGGDNAFDQIVFSGDIDQRAVTTYYAGAGSAGVFSFTEGCVSSDTVLCLDDEPGDRRFAVNIEYETAQGDGGSGAGEVTPLDPLGIDRGGVFSFFGRQNPEMLVKVIDGCGLNDRFWVFAAATTNVGYTMTVRDTRAEVEKVYSNVDGSIAVTVTDIDALATCSAIPQTPTPGSAGPASHQEPLPTASTAKMESNQGAGRNHSVGNDKVLGGPCVSGPATLCIDDAPGDARFSISLHFATSLGDGAEGEAMATSLASLGVTDGGILSFFDVTNPEVLIKVIDACDFNGHFWVFYAAATNLGFEVTVRDTTSGQVWSSENTDGVPAPTITDVMAFDACIDD